MSLAAAPLAQAAARLEVSGEVVARVPRLEVRVVVSNRGDTPATPLEISGELLGESRRARLSRGVGPGQQAAVILDFDPAPMRPGLHALTLLMEHPLDGPSDAAGNRPVESQRAYLLLALGARPDAAVRVEAGHATIDVEGALLAHIESADGQAHRVSLRVLTARGLRALDPPDPVTVPPSGEVTVPLRLLRAGAGRGTSHGVLVVAETLDGSLARTSVETATVEVAADPSLLPHLRWLLLVLGLGLLGAAAAAELWRRRGAGPGERSGTVSDPEASSASRGGPASSGGREP